MSEVCRLEETLEDRYVVAFDLSSSTWLSKAAAAAGVPNFGYSWLADRLWPVVIQMVNERINARNLPYRALVTTTEAPPPDVVGAPISHADAIGTAIVSHTGDGFIFLTRDGSTALTLVQLLRGASQGLWGAMHKAGIPLKEGNLPRVRATVTYGNVRSFSYESSCEAGAGSVPVPDAKDLPRLYFGQVIVLACRLLDSCEARCKYEVMLHQAAHAKMMDATVAVHPPFLNGLVEDAIKVKDFDEAQIVWGRQRQDPPLKYIEAFLQQLQDQDAMSDDASVDSQKE